MSVINIAERILIVVAMVVAMVLLNSLSVFYMAMFAFGQALPWAIVWTAGACTGAGIGHWLGGANGWAIGCVAGMLAAAIAFVSGLDQRMGILKDVVAYRYWPTVHRDGYPRMWSPEFQEIAPAGGRFLRSVGAVIDVFSTGLAGILGVVLGGVWGWALGGALGLALEGLVFGFILGATLGPARTQEIIPLLFLGHGIALLAAGSQPKPGVRSAIGWGLAYAVHGAAAGAMAATFVGIVVQVLCKWLKLNVIEVV